MKRRNFLRLLGVAAAAAPAAKLLGMPKDESGFYLDKAAPGTSDISKTVVFGKDDPLEFLNVKGKNLYVALYSSNPSNASGLVDCDYKEYSRVAVPRTPQGWRVQVPDNRVIPAHVENAKSITFPQCNGGVSYVRAFGVETEDRRVIWIGELTSPLVVSAGVTPEFASGDLKIDMDI